MIKRLKHWRRYCVVVAGVYGMQSHDVRLASCPMYSGMCIQIAYSQMSARTLIKGTRVRVLDQVPQHFE
jgi:hypothetical protein